MEKKSLGRGLEDISRSFMSSTGESKPQETTPVFYPTAIREALCSACLNVVEAPFDDPPKCRIFSFENVQYGVPFMDTIMPSYAKYCRYFEPVALKEEDHTMTSELETSYETEGQCDIEETVNSHKRIALQDDENVQKSLQNILSKHLAEGYEITRIDLEKEEEHSVPGHRTKRHEAVTVVRKGYLSF
jgi:hypothetical protein